MQVFRIDTLPGVYQAVTFRDLSSWQSRLTNYNAEPLRSVWPDPKTGYVVDPSLPDATFRAFSAGCFVIRENLLADEALATVFEIAAELLPVTVDGERCLIVNVLAFFNALFPQATEWEVSPGSGQPGTVRRGCFKAARLGRAPLFKIPQNPSDAIYCASGEQMYDFYKAVQNGGYTGLSFVEQLVVG